jgi:hypothetical protein
MRIQHRLEVASGEFRFSLGEEAIVKSNLGVECMRALTQ